MQAIVKANLETTSDCSQWIRAEETATELKLRMWEWERHSYLNKESKTLEDRKVDVESLTAVSCDDDCFLLQRCKGPRCTANFVSLWHDQHLGTPRRWLMGGASVPMGCRKLSCTWKDITHIRNQLGLINLWNRHHLNHGTCSPFFEAMDSSCKRVDGRAKAKSICSNYLNYLQAYLWIYVDFILSKRPRSLGAVLASASEGCCSAYTHTHT